MTDRQTDGQTDGQTKFSSLDRVCISCSAVKNENTEAKQAENTPDNQSLQLRRKREGGLTPTEI